MIVAWHSLGDGATPRSADGYNELARVARPNFYNGPVCLAKLFECAGRQIFTMRELVPKIGVLCGLS